MAARRFGARQYRVLRIIDRRRRRRSLVWAWPLRTTNPNRAYYGTDARAYQLLAGALLALTPAVIARAARHPTATRSPPPPPSPRLVVAATSAIDLDAIQRGTLITVITVALIAALEATHTGPAAPAPVRRHHRLPRQDLLRHLPVALARHPGHHPHLPPPHPRHHRPHRPHRHRASPPSATNSSNNPSASPPSSTATAAPSSPSASPPASSPPSSSSPPSPTHHHHHRHRRRPHHHRLHPRPHRPRLATPSRTTTRRFTNCYGKPADATAPSCTAPAPTSSSSATATPPCSSPPSPPSPRPSNLTLSVSVVGRCPWQRDLYAEQDEAGGKTLRSDDCKRLKDDLYDRSPRAAPRRHRHHQSKLRASRSSHSRISAPT